MSASTIFCIAGAVVLALVWLWAIGMGRAAALGDRQLAATRAHDDDKVARARRRRERMQEREARAMLRPPRDIVVAANGREPQHSDFVRALREGKDL